MKKKYLSLLLALSLVIVLFAGCGSTAGASAEADSAPASAASDTETAAAPEIGTEAAPEEAAASVAEEAADSDVEEAAEMEIDTSYLPEDYPRISDDGMTLSMFQDINPMMGLGVDSYGELPFWQELAERTGITIDWNMFSFMAAQEQLYLLIAANDLPNINALSYYYSDGISTAVEDEIFVNLAGYIEQYAPHYYQLIQREDVHPVVCDQDGNIIAFYEIADEQYPPNSGIILRGDWLEEQGLDTPVTYDEYEDVLLKLKNVYDVEAPIIMQGVGGLWLSAGLGVKKDVTLDADGNVIYGPIQEVYREYLQIMNKWYSEGLIYKDFYAEDTGTMISDLVGFMSAGRSVLTYAPCEFANMIEITDPNGYLAPGYIPRKDKDAQVHITEGIDPLVSLGKAYALGPNSTEEEIQAACMMINYFYTEEGALFANFGIEGQSFEYDENGEPWFTDLIIDNPDGLNQTSALVYYTGYMVPAHADLLKYNINTVTNWAGFVEVWASADNDYAMPQVSMTAEEQASYSAAVADVETYMDPVLAKFIIGDMDINDDAVWQEYLSNMDSLGAGKIVELYQAAYDRYLAS